MGETIYGLTELAEAPSFEDWFALTDKSDTAQSANGSTRKNKGQYALGIAVNAQTGTTYTYLTTDFRKLVTHTNGSAIAGTLPQAGASFPANWWIFVQNRGAGLLTITPTTSTIDGAASLVLSQGEGILIVSDGTNYFTFRGVGTSPPFETLTDGATVTWALGSRRVANATVTLGGNRTLAITGAASGSTGVLKVVQDGTGSRTLTLPAGSKVVGGGAGAITLTTTAGGIDVLAFYYDGTNYFWTFGKNFT